MSRARVAIGVLAVLGAAVVLGVVLVGGESPTPSRSPSGGFRLTQAGWKVVQQTGTRELPAAGALRYCPDDPLEYVEPRLAWSHAPLGERYGFAPAGSVRFRHRPYHELLRFLSPSGSFAPPIAIPWSPGSPPARGTLSFSMKIAGRTAARISLTITPLAGC
jgi:hypothetical protein